MIEMRERTERSNLLSVKTVSDVLGYHPQYVYRLIREGVIPSRQLGKGCRIYIPRDELKRIMPNVFAEDV